MIEVRSEITANVWKIMSSVGDRVAVGDILVILESMKMEIPVQSPSDGTVEEIHVSEGSLVDEGELVATLSMK
jgi:acetyl-CoA carboxylase biotin carboxyl carrier protein